MLYMAGGGRIQRLHGPFVADNEVEEVAKFLRAQGQPQYLEEITAAPEEDEDGDPLGGLDGEGSPGDLYDQAVAVVTRDRKASTSYVQRRLQIGYNRAASLIERMEKEGVVGRRQPRRQARGPRPAASAALSSRAAGVETGASAVERIMGGLPPGRPVVGRTP